MEEGRKKGRKEERREGGKEEGKENNKKMNQINGKDTIMFKNDIISFVKIRNKSAKYIYIYIYPGTDKE